MPKIASVLKEEITRLARKELRSETVTLKKVSAQTIHNWEAESTHPRERQVAAIAALRGVGKREAGDRLRELAERTDR